MVSPIGFWGIVVEPKKMYSQNVPVSFKMTMASLGPKAQLKEGSADVSSTLMLVHERDGEFSICTLTPGKVDQQALDVVIRQGDTIHLRVEGENAVHLIGYYIELDELNDMDEELSEGETLNSENMASCSDDEDGEDLDEYETDDESIDYGTETESENEAEFTDSEEEEEEVRRPKKKSTPKITLVNSDGEQIDDSDESLDSDEEDEDLEFDSDDFDSEDNSVIEDDSDEDDDSDEAESMEEDESEEEEIVKRKSPAASQATDSKKVKLTPTPQSTPKTQKTVDAKETPKPKQETPKPKVETPKVEKATPSKENQKPAPSNNASPAPGKTLVNKTLPNGLVIQDLNLGEGIKAQKGRKIDVTINLSTKDGKSLGKQTVSYTCGQPESAVPKGFDMGVIGMALGGERKLVVPPSLLEGGKGLNGKIPQDEEVVMTLKLDKVINTK